MQAGATSLSYTLASSDVLLAIIGIASASLGRGWSPEPPPPGELGLDLDLTGVAMFLGSGHRGDPATLSSAPRASSVTADLGVSVDTTRGLTARGTLGPIALPARSPSPLLEGVAATLRPRRSRPPPCGSPPAAGGISAAPSRP